jgi:hypothetical protein
VKRSAFLPATLLLAALSLVAIACGGSSDPTGDPSSADTTSDSPAGDSVADTTPDDSTLDDLISEASDLPPGRAGQEAFALAGEVCDSWAEWTPSDGEAAVAAMQQKAQAARDMSTGDNPVRDPVLNRLANDLEILVGAVHADEGSGVVTLTSRLIDEDCEQVG